MKGYRNVHRSRDLDLLSYKLIERELLDLGNEIRRINQEFDDKKLNNTGIVYVRRIRWLNKIIDESNILYKKVDAATKKIMKSLYIHNKSMEQVSKMTGESVKHIRNIHRLVVNAVAENLGMINIGESVLSESSRYLTADVKREVNERYKGKCAICESKNKIHYHHIHYFSEGGTNDADNLMILCADCHAEQHKGERAYYALRAMAEG